MRSYRPSILNIMLMMAQDSTLVNAKERILVHMPEFNRQMDDDLEKFLSNVEEREFSDEYFLGNYFKLLSYFEQKDQIEKSGRKLLPLDSLELLLPTVVASFLQMSLSVDENMVQEAYSNLYMRSVLMNQLKAVDRMDLVPTVYKEQTEIGKMIVYEFMSLELGSPVLIDLLGEIDMDGQAYMVYKVKIEDDEQHYTCVYRKENGLEVLEYDYTNCFSDFEPDITDWKDHATRMIHQENSYQ